MSIFDASQLFRRCQLYDLFSRIRVSSHTYRNIDPPASLCVTSKLFELWNNKNVVDDLQKQQPPEQNKFRFYVHC